MRLQIPRPAVQVCAACRLLHPAPVTATSGQVSSHCPLQSSSMPLQVSLSRLSLMMLAMASARLTSLSTTTAAVVSPAAAMASRPGLSELEPKPTTCTGIGLPVWLASAAASVTGLPGQASCPSVSRITL